MHPPLADARRRRVGRPAQLHRGAARHPDRRARVADGRDRVRPAPALRLDCGKTRRQAQRRHHASCRSPTPSTTSSAGSCRRAAAAKRRTRSCAASCARPNFAPPMALRRLAQITDFDLFVTTTFDPLLEQAINAERFSGAQSTEVIAYAPNRVADLADRARAAPAARRLSPVRPPVRVAHLRDLGRGHARVHLRAAKRAPRRRRSCSTNSSTTTCCSSAASFANWLARLFLRMAKSRRLSDPRDVGEVLADNHSRQGRAPDGVPAAGQRAHARLQRRARTSSTSCIAAGLVAPRRRRRHPAARGAAAFPAARARDARSRGVHQLRARDLRRGAEDQGGPRRRGHQDLVRPRAPRGRRRLRPQDPAQHRALLVFHPRRARRRRSAAWKALPAANGATPSTVLATWPMAPIFILPMCIDDTDTGAAKVPDKVPRRTSRALPGGEVRLTSRSASRPPVVPMNDSARHHHRRHAPRPSTPCTRWLGFASFTEETRPLRREEESPNSAAASAKAARRSCSAVRPGQTSILRAGIVRAAAEGAIAALVLDYSLIPVRPSRSSRRSSARRRQRYVDAARHCRSGESLSEFLHHRDDVLRDAMPEDADPAADLRPVRECSRWRRAMTSAASALRNSSRTWPISSKIARQGARSDDGEDEARRERSTSRAATTVS